jgi:hypothetical protein
MSYGYMLAEGQWCRNTAAITIDAAFSERIAVNKPVLVRGSAAEELPVWVGDFQRRGDELIGLRQDWDGRGSAAVRIDALMFAYSVLSQSMTPSTVPPSIIPLGNGGVQLVWTSGVADVEVEVTKPNHVGVYYVEHATGKEREWQATTEFTALASLLRSTFTR